ncbi:PAS domain S-box protein [Ferrovibrio xuzhouensis]|uniref:histidine kinase n=1 Tax=Ferrovibrio xuzhouensis TaxID=1576914 RepID=A0ABV7VJU1_9PROT
MMDSELGRIVDALPGLIWTALPDGTVKFVNKRWSEYTGLAFEETASGGWQAVAHPDDLLQLAAKWEALVNSGKAGGMEGRLRRHDGEYRNFLFRISPVSDASGMAVEWCGLATDIEERFELIQSLRASEAQFRLTVDGLPAMVTLHAPDGSVVYANRHALEFSGTTLTEIQKLPQGFSFHPDDRQRFLECWAEARSSGETYKFEGRRLQGDGSVRWYSTIGYPLRGADGQIVVWYLIHNDVNEKRIAEARFAGEMKLLEMMASGAPMSQVLEAICRVVEEICSDCTCSVTLVNGDRLLDGASPSLPPEFTKSINGRPISVENGPCAMAACLREQVISADIAKETRWHTYGWPDLALSFGLQACWSTPIVAPCGSVLGTLGLHYHKPSTPNQLQQDLIAQFTHLASIAIERSHEEDALKRNQAFLAEAQRLTSIGSFSWKPTTGEILWSDETYRLFQIDPGTPVTFDLISTRYPTDEWHLLTKMKEDARQGVEKLGFGHRLIMPDGTVKHVHLVAQGRVNRDGEMEYIGACQDITDRRYTEETLDKVRSELIRVSRVMSLSALTASIAHEVNQPLAGIITNASTGLRMLSAVPPNIEGALETARRTIRDGNRASEVIARLRALFAGKELVADAVDLNAAAHEVVALNRTQFQRARVEVRQDFEGDLPLVKGDRVQLQQVIMNLVTNAMDALSGVHGRPRQMSIMTSSDSNGDVCLTVSDNGIGIDPEVSDRLFDAFFSTKNDGMGIGLSVSRSIIEKHQGRIWAERNDMHGSTFSFSISGIPPLVVDDLCGGKFATSSIGEADESVGSRR